MVDGLKYQDSHEWAKVDGDTAVVGLSDFAQVIMHSARMHGAPSAHCDAGKQHAHAVMRYHAQEELGDIVYVELPEVGSEVKQKEQFGVVESVKVGAGLLIRLIPRYQCLLATSFGRCQHAHTHASRRTC